MKKMVPYCMMGLGILGIGMSIGIMMSHKVKGGRVYNG